MANTWRKRERGTKEISTLPVLLVNTENHNIEQILRTDSEEVKICVTLKHCFNFPKRWAKGKCPTYLCCTVEPHDLFTALSIHYWPDRWLKNVTSSSYTRRYRKNINLDFAVKVFILDALQSIFKTIFDCSSMALF